MVASKYFSFNTNMNYEGVYDRETSIFSDEKRFICHPPSYGINQDAI